MRYQYRHKDGSIHSLDVAKNIVKIAFYQQGMIFAEARYSYGVFDGKINWLDGDYEWADLPDDVKNYFDRIMKLVAFA